MGKSKEAKESKRRRPDPAAQAGDDTVSDDKDTDMVEAADDNNSSASHEKDVQISFKSADEINRALGTVNADLLIQGFTHLREHLKICNRHMAIESTEALLLKEACRRVVYEWAGEAREFEAVSAAWHFALSNSVARLDGLIPSVVSGLLAVFDAAATYKHGSQLVRLVLDGFMRAVYRALNTPRSSACAAVLQMLYQMVTYSHGEHADQVRHGFDWTQKSLPALANTRSSVIGFSIRRLWVRFVFSFFSAERCKSFNQLLGARRIISDMFQSVEKDTYQELHTLLESVYASIVLNEDISRADKVRVFGLQLIGNLVKACQNSQVISPQKAGVGSPALFVPSEADKGSNQPSAAEMTSDSVSALVTRFLRGLMAFPGHGICFKQYGLYTPARKWVAGGEAESDDRHDVATFTKSMSSAEMQSLCNSQILRILVVCISPAASRQMAELAIEVMRASPELIAPFWRNYHCSFEPRLSLGYLRNTAFAIKVLSLPLPVPQEADAWHGTPPRLNTLVEHIMPYPLDPVLLGRGLTILTAPLVRYRNLLLVDMALRKLGDARAWIQAESRAAGAEAGKWAQLDQRLLAAIKQRIPLCKHIVLIHRHLLALADGTAPAADDDLREAESQHAMFANAMMRVMSGYQTHFSELVLETHFEFGSLISGINLPDVVSGGKRASERIRNPMNAHTLLYLLRALTTTPAALVRWMTRVKPLAAEKNGSSEQQQPQHTYLGVVLMVYLFAVQPELREAARVVATEALQSTGLFDHDASGAGSGAVTREAACWLDALSLLVSPHAGRNTRLTFIAEGGIEKGQAAVMSLEEAIQLSSKLPYKYADRIYASAVARVGGSGGGEWDDRLPFSPLLSAVVEAALLRMALGSKSQGASWRGDEFTAARIAAEMRTNGMFALVSEVVCRIAESHGPAIARRLSDFVAVAVRLTLAPRIAKLDAAKNPQKVDDETRYCAKIEAAFAIALADTTDYLSVVSGALPECAVATSGCLPRKADARLKCELSSACASIEDSLSGLMGQLVSVLHEHSDCVSTHTATAWMLEQAGAAVGGARQAVFIATIAWISAYHRASHGGLSLWDTPAFRELAPEILQIDDRSFLLAVFRHLVACRSLGAVLTDSSVQRLMVHIMLANRGSAEFCSYAVLLVRRLAAQAPDTAGCEYAQTGSALSYVFALVGEHIGLLDSAPGARQQLALKARVLEQYSRTLCPLVLCSALEAQSALAYGLADLARKSARVWLNPIAASTMWYPLVTHLGTALASKAGASTTAINAAQQPFVLSLICIASPAVAESSRAGLISTLSASARAEQSQQVFCLAASAVFVLLRDSRSNSLEALEQVRLARADLSSRVVALWLSSLGAPAARTEDDEHLLERAVRQATSSLSAAGAGVSRSTDTCLGGLSRSIGLVRSQLPRLGRPFAVDAPIDAASALDYMWARAEDKSHYAFDLARRELLARIISADDRLRLSACLWVDRMLEHEGLTKCRLRFLAWLTCAMSAHSTRENECGQVVWDTDSVSRLLFSLCLKVGANLFAADGRGATPRLGELAAADDGMLFVANVYVQNTEDVAAVAALRRRVAKASDVSLLPLRAALLRSMALRIAVFSAHIDQFLGAFADLVELGQHAVPAMSSLLSESEPRALASAQQTVVLRTLASAMEHCVRTASGLSTAAESVDSWAPAAKKSVEASFCCIEALSRSTCLSFEQADSYAGDELSRLASCYPVSVYRLIAFMSLSAHFISAVASIKPDPGMRWFSVLRTLLDCRLFGMRMQTASVRDLLALTVSGLWGLAKPSLSRWSASLDDYLSLDQLESLVGVYGGTRSMSDMVLLRVIGDYEHTTRQSIQRVALVFGSAAASTYLKERVGRSKYLIERDENDIGVVGEDTLSNALLSVDSSKLFRTVLNFPINADESLEKTDGDPAALLLTALLDSGRGAKLGHDVFDSSLVYDPRFILPWVWTVVSARVQVDIRRLFECNAAGLALVALSSANLRFRKLAYYILDILYARVADAKNLSGQRQYLLLLDSLRNAIDGRNDTTFPRIPYAITIFVATSLNVMMHPEHALFVEVNQLLLRRPYLRLSDIPLFRDVMHSTTNARRQRTHVIRQAAQSARAFDLGMAAFKSADFVNVSLALAASPLGDVLTSKAALTMLFHLTSSENPRGLVQHVSKHSFSLLAWIRQQVSLELNALIEAASMAKLESGETADSALALVRAALRNVTALMRIVLRAIANFPLVVLSDGSFMHDRFWVVQSAAQACALGQTIVMGLVRQTLDALACSLERLGLCAEYAQPGLALSALILLRTCVDSARLLADMQAGASAQRPPALLAPAVAQKALQSLRVLEHVVNCSDRTVHLRYDPCSVVSVAKAQFSESLFCNDIVVECYGNVADSAQASPCLAATKLGECYRLCVDSLLGWCLSVPWATCTKRDAIDIISRAIVVGAPGATQAAAWIRDCQEHCTSKDDHVLNSKLQTLALSR